jgi:hypothetical protein
MPLLHSTLRSLELSDLSSGYARFHMLWRIISDFLKTQPIQILNKEWVIRQSEDTFKVCRTGDRYRKPDQITYSVKIREKILFCELDGKEISRFDINQIVDIQIEVDKSGEEYADRIILIMKTGEKEAISNYMDSYGMNASGHGVVVKALRYNLGLQSWLHLSPDM